MDIIEGCGSTSNQPSDPVIARSVRLPPSPPHIFQQTPTDVLEGEEQADWLTTANFAEEHAMVAEISEIETFEPRTLTEEKGCPDWPLRKKAIEEELETLRKAGTWELTEPPSGANIVGSKWVFRAKTDAAGNVICYKARRVAQGVSQVPDVDHLIRSQTFVTFKVTLEKFTNHVIILHSPPTRHPRCRALVAQIILVSAISIAFSIQSHFFKTGRKS